MTSEVHVSIKAGHISDLALHDEIKCRAYALFEQHHTVDGYHPRDMLREELPLVVYAAAQLDEYAKGEVRDTKALRAARV